jgi:hypothetical protein
LRERLSDLFPRNRLQACASGEKKEYASVTPSACSECLRRRKERFDRPGELVRTSQQWRDLHRVDDILINYTPPTDFWCYYLGAILQGRDLENGDPIYVGRLGVTDELGLLHKYGTDELLQHAICIREFVTTGDWIARCVENERNGRPIPHVTRIEDLHSLSVMSLVRHPSILSL